jgi:hypothetical protein
MSFVQEIAFEFKAEMSNCTKSLINPEKYVFSFPQKQHLHCPPRIALCSKAFPLHKELNDRNDPQTHVDIPINCFHFLRF